MTTTHTHIHTHMQSKLFLFLVVIITKGHGYRHIEATFFSGQCSAVKKQTGCTATICYCNSDLCNDFLANNTKNDSSLNICYEYSDIQLKKTIPCNGSCMTRKKNFLRKCFFVMSGCEYSDYEYPYYSVWNICNCQKVSSSSSFFASPLYIFVFLMVFFSP